MLETTYCTLPDVKEILRIEDTKSDHEIFGCILSAYNWVNDILEGAEISTPLSSPYPQAVVDANKFRAVAELRERTDSAEAQKFYERAERRLNEYMGSTEDEIALIIGTDES